jgi:TolA-binding protein
LLTAASSAVHLELAMTMFFSTIVLAALSVLPSDRLAMADRLFNKGDYQAALVEYRALEGEKTIAADELLFRFAECAFFTGDKAAAMKGYATLAEKHPDSKHAASARLRLALAATGEERTRRLRALDTDRVPNSVRIDALYHLGVATDDVDALARCVKLDPKGRFAPFANLRRATIMTRSGDAATRRKGLEVLLDVAYGKSALADDALFFAASFSYGEKKYGEASSLFRSYRRKFPDGKHAKDAQTLSVWCDYMNGRYADALAACGEGATDELAYVKACCVAQTGGADAAALFKKYLDGYPQGRYRRDATLRLARLEFDAALAADDSAKLLEAAKRAASAGLAADALRLAWTYEKAGFASQAEAEYARIVRDFADAPEAAKALYAQAMLAVAAKDWAKADLRLAEALAHGRLGAAQRTKALYWRGVAALQLGHESEGAAFLKEALKGELGLDESREARLLVASCDWKAGRADEAKATYSKLVREGACARMNAAKILEVGNLLGGDDAAICAKALTEQGASEWRQFGWEMLGRREASREAYTAAIDAYRKAMAEPVRTTAAANASLALGKLEARAGEHDKAEATLKEAVKLNAADPSARAEAYLALAQNAAAKGDAKAAKGYATVVVTLFSETPFAKDAEKILNQAADRH